MRSRDFAGTEDNGYHNATLGTTGVALTMPKGARGALVSVSAGCFVGIRPTNVLVTFNDANYGSILNGYPVELDRIDTAQCYLHIAPWTGTAVVAINYY